MKHYAIKPSFWQSSPVYYFLVVALCTYDFTVFNTMLSDVGAISNDFAVSLLALLGVITIDIGISLMVDLLPMKNRTNRIFGIITLGSLGLMFLLIMAALAYNGHEAETSNFAEEIKAAMGQASVSVGTTDSSEQLSETLVRMLMVLSTLASTGLLASLTATRKSFTLLRSLEKHVNEMEAINRMILANEHYAQTIETTLLEQYRYQTEQVLQSIVSSADSCKMQVRNRFAEASRVPDVENVMRQAFVPTKLSVPVLRDYELSVGTTELGESPISVSVSVPVPVPVPAPVPDDTEDTGTEGAFIHQSAEQIYETDLPSLTDYETDLPA